MSLRQKKSPDSTAAETTPTSTISGLLAAAVEAIDVDAEEVKVNNASTTEMKHACDDALKRFLSRPELFNQIYTHTDVRLALGWASVFVAGATGLYGWKIDFEQSKPVVWAGVILYVTLTTLQTLYAYFVEKDTVFVGKRKTFDKRIVTERITIASNTTPSSSLSSILSSSSSASTSASASTSSSAPSTSASNTTSSPSTIAFPSTSSSSTTPPPANCPQYTLTLAFLRSTSGGKSLLGKGKSTASSGYNAFFDEKGAMDVKRFERWVGECVGDVMEGKHE